MSYVDHTWVAYALDEPVATEAIERALGRVRAHYEQLYAEPLPGESRVLPTVGMALWRRDDPRLRWPCWIEDGGTAVASTNAVTGWERVVGEVEPARAPLELGRALASDPERVVELNPPFVLAVLHSDSERLVIVNDFLATARLYELRTPSGWVWSNRLAALPLFAGTPPELDPEGWAIHAGAGWFLGRSTPLRGAGKVRAGSAITVEAPPSGAIVGHHETDAVRRLVAPRRASLDEQAGCAAEQSVALARSIGRVWDVAPTINLSGGRDSRISAAGAIAAGLEARFRTMNIEPGEVDAARQLLEAAPGALELDVLEMESGEPDDSLAERIGAIHLVHDGLANPMGGQGTLELPQRGFAAPLVTGHGGELAHGFYYDAARLRRELRPGTRRRLVSRLERSGRQRHSSAREDAYALYLAEVECTLDEGRAHGVRGPSLLDYYYLVERLPHRAGLGSRNDRYSACVTPAFVRGSFDLSPRQRTRAALHRAVISELMPAWSRIAFFHGGGGRMRPMRRSRIWERPRHSRDMEEMIASPELWSDAFDPGRIQVMWREAKAGEGHSHYEAAFMRIAWRVCYVQHAEQIAERIRTDGQASLVGGVSRGRPRAR
jgi:hypothetical protein